MSAPTSILPPLARLSTYPASQISDALHDLRSLYIPSRLIRRAKYRTRKGVPDSGYASQDEDEDLDILRADPFERDYAIKWTTGFVARSSSWAEDDPERAQITDSAIALIALFAGDEPEEDVSRSFSFAGSNGKDVHVELNDAPLNSSDHTSVGLQSWGASIILAEKICQAPDDFGLSPGKRVLELGAGTGMLSIVAAKLLDNSTIIATDYHPDVLANLSHNAKTNLSDISVLPFDWEHPTLDVSPFNTPFDTILAADVVYHPQHALWIRTCVEHTLLKPSGIFYMIVTHRISGRHEGMSDTVDEVFAAGQKDVDSLALAILDRQTLGKKKAVGRADEQEYRLFKIGWV